METPDLLFCIGFGLVATFVVTLMCYDWFRRRKRARRLKKRTQNDDTEFRKLFPDPNRAEIAVRTRRVLVANLEMPLEGLTPDDRLDDDLGAELAANPDLFWRLEAEFGIKTDVDDLDLHGKSLARLVTFGDLVEYVERMISHPPRLPDADENEKLSRSYRLAIRSIPVLCISGLVIVVAAILVQNKNLMNAGGLIFLSGFVVWGLANGGEMLRGIIHGLRGTSVKEVAARPWSFIVLTALALFFLWVGGFLLWGIFKNLMTAR